MNPAASDNRRILLVDDNPSIHEDFRRLLAPPDAEASSLDAEAEALFGGTMTPFVAEPCTAMLNFELDSAMQGQEGLARVQAALAAGRPYALAFVDMRMPPGWDGLTTISKLWELDARLQVVICTAYSDRSWDEIQRTLTARDRWLVLKKPFDKVEVLQLAQALTEKWNRERAAPAHRVDPDARARVQAILDQLDALARSPLAPEQQAPVDIARAEALRLLDSLPS
jgi:two-component system NtrC family sensor kinase